MLNDRINELIKEIDATKLAISEYADIDRTYISHISSGKRIPNKHSASVVKLIDGIYRYAKDNDKLNTISEITGVDIALSSDDFKTGITDWLYEDMPTKYVIDKHGDTMTYIYKINVLLDRFNISNAEITEKLNCDPAVISRYRNGGRDVNPASSFSLKLANELWDRVESAEDYSFISKSSGIKKDNLNRDSFQEWFTDYNAPIVIPRDSNAKSLLETFTVTATTKRKRLRRSKNFILPTKQEDAPMSYIGNEGLRQAVEQFFATALEKKPRYLCLYSDSSMEWMTEDPQFFTKWQNSMLLLIQKGVKIIIIHNLKRSTPELTNAIIAWLPLYQTGKVEPYYFEHARLSNIFSHSLFINPKGHAITGLQIKGTEENSIYHYLTDTNEISMLCDSYDKMKENAVPLVEHPDSIPKDNDSRTYEYNGINIVITKDGVYLTHNETGVKIGLKHHLLVKSFNEFCEEL